jgi:rhomboid protease GluP
MGCISRGRPGVTTIGAVLIAVFVWEVAWGLAGNEAVLLRVGALKTLHVTPADWWRIATYSFLHFSLLHLAMNLAALCWLGGIVERRIGTARMLIVYAAAVVGSGIAGVALGPFLPTSGSAVGASGAIFGLLGAALILIFGSASPADRRLRGPLLIVFFVGVLISLMPGVSAAGHLGGLVGGALASPRKISGHAE